MKVNIFRKIMSFILVFFLCLQVLPVHAVYVHAEENNDQTNDEQGLNVDGSSAASQQTDLEEETVITDDISDDESGYTVSDYNVNSANLSVDEGIATVADEGEIGSVIGSSEVWNIIQANGGLKSPYAFKDGVMYGEYNSIELLKQWMNSYHTSSTPITWTDNKLTSMPLDNGKQLILLSITDPSVYQSTNFTAGSVTGSIDLTDKIESTISFQGLGSSTSPFNGTFVNSGFTINRTLFNNLEYANERFNNNQLTIDWKGETNTGAMVASSIHCAVPSDLTVLLTRTEKEKYNFRGAVFGEISGGLNLSVSFDRNTANNDTLINKVTENQNNAGVIANTLISGTLNLTVTNFPNNIEIGIDGLDDVEKSNAGLLIGYMNDASLNLNGFPVISFTATVQSAKGAAGGLIGRVELTDNQTPNLTINSSMDLSKTTVLGKYTGGIAGYVKDITVQFTNDKSVKIPEKLGIKANNIVNNGYVTSTCTGGIFGWYCVNETSSFNRYDGKGFIYPSNINVSADSSSGETGAVFGKLELKGNAVFSIEGTEESRLGMVSSVMVTDDANITSSGGLIGTVTAESLSNQLSVEYVDVKLTGQSTNRINYLGGIIGTVNNASVAINNVKVTVPQPTAKSYFGGLAGKLDSSAIMQVASQIEIATTETTSPAAITKGGGLVGEMTSKTVLSITGTTDFSKVKYQSSKDVGQIVGKQDNSLVFAYGNGNGTNGNGTNWTYQRSSEQSRVDDIGNYGQVIRLGDKLSSDLITIVDTNVTFKAHGDYGTINTADDFALHAIAFQTENVFMIYSNGSPLNKTNISIENDIDLTGTGIQGFTRDNGSSWKFSGENNGTGVGVVCNGSEKTVTTVTINTGEVYGLRNGNIAKGDGSGQCYYHGYYGLFGYANSAQVINLNIKGTMNIGIDTNMYAGFVFGCVSGGNGTATIRNKVENVKILPDSAINIDGSSATNREVNVGGMIGGIYGDKTDMDIIYARSNLNITYSANHEKTALGGIVGLVKHKKTDIKLKDVSVGGNILANNITNNAHIGGLIADFVPDSSNNFATLSLENTKVSANLSSTAKTSAGGLLGYYWNNVDVLFDGAGETYAVSTNGSALTYNGNASTGGLCYAATGRWSMNGKAVDMGNTTTVSNGTGALGLLVCHGESQGTEAGSYSNVGNALYLVMDTNWKIAYLNEQVIVNNNSHDVFDEIVAYTAANNDIMNNNAGIISLKTEAKKVDLSSAAARNTYENRTTYGMNNKTNSNSRYYYNLNVMNSIKNDIDTAEEFLIWSVSKYCSSNILRYLPNVNSNTITGTLDMDGYSYYPVSIENQDVSMENAVITFWNQVIEEKENGNKSTLSTTGRTQHFAMHSGVFYNYATDLNSTQVSNLTVSNLTLIGTVGMVDSGSGALICGTVQGYNGANHTKITINTLKVDHDTKPLSVSAINTAINTDYAPLIINNVYSYSTLNITGVTVGDGDASATSLMGRVGNQNDTNTQGINISFSEMKLSDTEGRFTKSTFLHSLYYVNQNNSVVYNFAKDEDWVDSTHPHNVTYGKEIGGTSEYAEYGNNPHQYHYAQSLENVSYTGNKFTGEDRDNFSSYLPYVYVSFDSATNYHEILVNSSLTDIRLGCGTYGDPYQISNGSELQSIAIFLSTGIASKGWTINLSENDGQGNVAFCTGESHITYVYNGAEWKSTDGNNTVSTVTVRTYLLNAYYRINDDIILSNFPGIGTRANPFRGVIIGENGKTITLKDTLPKGFIVCSYGSVVKDLNIQVEGTIAVNFTEIQNNSGYTSESYFGGVIGCILGGDNIIDNVDLIYSGFNVALGLEKPYLIPVGGFVGVISGGGIIFRDTNTISQNLPTDKISDANYFYANKYVGRVIQGFAVQEGNGVKLDNSNKNYQICKLDSYAINGISRSDNQVSINGAQALLVFSSVTNSGGAGEGALLPYYTDARSYWNNGAFSATYVGGKVRNASYTKVGNVADAQDPEYQQSLKDDFQGFGSGNTSYLDTNYAGGGLWNICGDNDVNITLDGVTYDMTSYGNGYRSISPRYLANAVCNDLTNSNASENYKLLNPLISSFRGNEGGNEAGSRIVTDIIVKEYVDDDHHAVAVGGLFNTLRSSANATIENITVGGNSTSYKAVIKHEYYECSGNTFNDATHKNWGKSTQGFTNLNYAQGRGLVAVGGIVGNSAAETNSNILFKNITTSFIEMKGPFDAGGIIGHTGLVVSDDQANSFENKNYHICYLVGQNTKYIIPSFQNCSYNNLDLYGGMMIGGYIGIATYGQYAPNDGKTTQNETIEIASGVSVLGKDSHIECKRGKSDDGIDNSFEPKTGSTTLRRVLPATGGLIGCSVFHITINNTVRSTIENVDIRSTRSAGGIVAWPFYKVTINNVSIIGGTNKNQIGDLPNWKSITDSKNEPSTICEFAGGLVGYFESSEVLTITNCKVENINVVASLRQAYPCYAGGLVGNVNSGNSHIIANCEVNGISLANTKYSNSSKVFYGGGLIGGLQAGHIYSSNILIKSISNEMTENAKIGNLMSIYEGKTDNIVYLAGVSIQDTQISNDIGGTKTTKCYIAYGDYNGNASSDDKDGSVILNSKAPHVTTSPKGVSIPVSAADAEGNKEQFYLYGDGANPSIVKQIYDDRQQTIARKYTYSQTSNCTFDTRYKSTFYAEMGLTEETANGIPDFPVLQVTVANKTTVSKQIVDYLDLVTNKGFSTARDTSVNAGGHISYSIDLYKWNEEDKYFVKNPAGVTKAFSGSGDNYETSFSNYDTGKNQFELLTVTFTEKEYKYTVLVPIVVRRMLEIDFSATLKDSPSFQMSEYEVYNSEGYKPNITVGYGTSVSALLTYTYNRAIGENQDYDWNFHIENGGFMGDPEQTIQFYNPQSKLKSLPSGTQLVLLDCFNNNKAYSYEVKTQSENEGTKIKFSDFKDSSGNSYSKWLSEIVDVKATSDPTGKWIKVNENEATVRIKKDGQYLYFRQKNGSETVDSNSLFSLSVVNAQPVEQFYLVIYIPDSSVAGIPVTNEIEGKNLNGYISSVFTGLSGKVECNVNPIRTKKNGIIVSDPQSSSECTYNFLSGYSQKLTDNSSDKSLKLDTDPEAYVLLNNPEADGNYLLHMDMEDEITVVKGQKDTADIDLYYKESISLAKYEKQANGSVTLASANGFPTGCFGTVEFYVYTKDELGNIDKNYKWYGNNWIEANVDTVGLSYEWTSNGQNMELYLGTDNSKDGAVNLSAIRELAKSGNEKFYIRTKVDIHMSVPAAEQAIAGSITKGNSYTKMSYTSFLATDRNAFSSTNYVESAMGKVRYYQSRSGNSTISHSANDSTQLGINCSDLTSANGVIYTTGVYDLTTVSNAESLIQDANKVIYTLTLWQRQEDGGYQQVTEDLGKYISDIRIKDKTISYQNGYHWVDEKEGGSFSSIDPENGKRFLIPIRIQVNTDVEANRVTFANYQLRLTATLYKNADIIDQPVNSETTINGITVYTRYDYVTYTITRILTNGYWGE